MLILASKSPRRQALLKWIAPEFEVIPSGFDEHTIQEPIPEKLVRKLAQKKAQEVQKRFPNATVIGCDTVVVSPKHQIFGIPKDEVQAHWMLKELSGKTHKVITGGCVVNAKKCSIFHKTTKVTFMQLSETEINDYLATKEPFDKAGAYGIQGYAGAFVTKINGDYHNVVGLPIQTLRKILQIYEY